MSAHVSELLPEWTLGVLEADDAARVESHLATCAACASEARAFSDSTVAIAASLRREAPAPQILHRVLAAAESKGRLARFTDALASFFDIGADKARALLDATDEPRAWMPDPSGISLIHLNAGTRYATADAGLVRFPAGIQWPLHKHVGDEHHLFLEGGIRENETGREYHAGDVLISGAGSQHSFHVLPGVDCVAAVILTAGIEMPPGTPLAF